MKEVEFSQVQYSYNPTASLDATTEAPRLTTCGLYGPQKSTLRQSRYGDGCDEVDGTLQGLDRAFWKVVYAQKAESVDKYHCSCYSCQ